jgi:hypothetical protein
VIISTTSPIECLAINWSVDGVDVIFLSFTLR